MLALLAEAAIRALVLGGLTWLALRALRIRNPYVEKLVWRTLLIASLMLPALLYWQLAPVFEIRIPPLVVTATDPATGGPAALSRVAQMMILLPALYVVVAVALLVRFVAGFARLARISSAATSLVVDGDVRTSTLIRTPATFGSIVLLPAEARALSAAELDMVLSHERAHVGARDCFWHWLAQLHAIAFWFSPYAWLLRQRLLTLAEATSDEAVLAANHDPISYAQLLLDFAHNTNPGRAAMSVSGPKISARIERILSHSPPALPPRRIARASAFGLLIAATLFAAASFSGSANPADYAALNGDDPAGPHIVDYGDLARLDDYYPPLAVQGGITGSVILGATLDADGRVIDAVVLEEKPAEPQYGFGTAALAVARTVRFDNSRKQLRRVKFMVRFALDR